MRKDDDRAQIFKPPRLWLAPQSDHGSAACAETEAFFQYGPPQPFFELSWLALQEARAREVAQRLMTGRKFRSPPLLWLAPQSDHGSAARAETEALFQYGPPQSFFLARPTKSTSGSSRISQPPLLWLAPQSDHGSAACAETEAFFQYGPPQPFFELSWLALQKARAREVAQRLIQGANFSAPPSYGSLRNPITGVPRARKLKLFSNIAKSTRAGSWRNEDDRAQISQPPFLMARSAIRSRECRVRGN